MADSNDIEIKQGKTFSLVLRWEAEPIVYKAITAISFANGAPRLTVPNHETLNEWRGAITRVKGPKQINAKNVPPRESDYVQATVIDADTIELNKVTPCDEQGNEWPAYVSGGFWQYNTPVDLAGYTARMSIKNRIGGTELLLLTTENGRIAIDNTAKTITFTISAADTAAIDWKKGVFEVEMVNGSYVCPIYYGNVSVTQEVAT